MAIDDPYDGPLAIANHAVIGDRRSAALVAADGAIVWYCLPHYAGTPVFGAILDPARGGFWRMGPAQPGPGTQRYESDSMTLVTSWELPAGGLELTDTMAWPWDDRRETEGGPEGHVILRRLRCTHGSVQVQMDYRPRNNFATPAPLQRAPLGVEMSVEGRSLTLWTCHDTQPAPEGVSLQATLAAGETVWSVLAWGEESQQSWSASRAATEMAAATGYWQDWVQSLPHPATDLRQHRCHALILKLQTYAPTGSPVAAPTSSLPERLGGDRNWDYRYAWVRDAALCVSVLSQIGDLETGRRYMDCLATYGSSTESPLQVVYGVDGELDLPEHKRWDLAGYRESRPVRTGNRACGQRQLDSLGFFVDSALTYLQCGGEWTEDHWTMVRRAADYTMDRWQLPDSGLWELLEERQYVSSKVMSWVALDRAIRIAERIGATARVNEWRCVRDAIHDDVLRNGWSAARQAFTECYESDSLDASALLIPLMGFLPVDHPQVTATVERIQAELSVNGFVYRSRDRIDGPVEAREGAFLPCSCWLAMVLAMSNRLEEAQAILDQVASLTGDIGILSEQVDPTTRELLGNLPLVFSHAEYLRACLIVQKQREAEASSVAGGKETT
ncbi:MAG: glycoside hydrolase family 15 protein [Chloroflexota bacterium]|nr:glycoside hydrolase family 15 protein [Chloroflexota bacterium]